MMMATSVEMPSMRAMKRGPMSLQTRSIRLIRALMAYASQFGTAQELKRTTSQRLFTLLRHDNKLFKT